MKRSGRSVEDASRVIEIEEVLVARIGVGLQRRAKLAEDLALDVFLFGCGFDDQIATRECVIFLRRLDARERVLAVLLADRLFGDLPRHVAVDGGHAGLDAVRFQIIEKDGIAGERAHMRDSVAHLAGADYPDTLNFDHVFVRSMRSPGSWRRIR